MSLNETVMARNQSFNTDNASNEIKGTAVKALNKKEWTIAKNFPHFNSTGFLKKVTNTVEKEKNQYSEPAITTAKVKH